MSKPGESKDKESAGATTRVNEKIRVPQIRLINEKQEQVGVIETFKALEMARQLGLDLVEVAPDAVPPVCKIMDYGRFRYERQKQEAESKKKQHKVQWKEIRLRPKIDPHDMETKLKQAKGFLEKDMKLQLVMLFRGREFVHKNLARDVLMKFVEDLGEHIKVEQPPKMEGRRMSMVVAPVKK